VPYRNYLLKLKTLHGDVIDQKLLNVDSKTAGVEIALTQPQAARPPSGGISAARLMYRPPKKARHSFAAAQRLSRSGRYAEAARELEQAVALAPDYANAHSNLGAQYLRMGRYEEAVVQISRAIEVGQPSAPDLANLACAQAALLRVDEAVRLARAALSMDPGYVNAHFVLGMLLVGKRSTMREALSHLAAAADAYPQARTFHDRARAILAGEIPKE
jgi:tetratricopeptide (TPR) repeat protein